MYKKLILCIGVILTAIGLSGYAKQGDNMIYSKYCDMIVLDTYERYTIVEDRDTGVLYILELSANGGGCSPLLNADGTPKNINDYEKE